MKKKIAIAVLVASTLTALAFWKGKAIKGKVLENWGAGWAPE